MKLVAATLLAGVLGVAALHAAETEKLFDGTGAAASLQRTMTRALEKAWIWSGAVALGGLRSPANELNINCGGTP